jgi:hypothetical protein
MMTTKSASKRFRGETAKAAEAAALKWSNDVGEHAPVTVESITAQKKGNKFIATIVYRE